MTAKGYEAWIALRYLRVRGRELFISLISWISVGGVAVGVAALIVVTSVMNGFERDLRDKILGANSHARVIMAEGAEMTAYDEVASKALANKEVKRAIPYVEAQLMLMTDYRVQGVMLRGFDHTNSQAVAELAGYVKGDKSSGREVLASMAGQGRPGILVGTEMAANWGLQEGDLVKVVSPAASSTPVGLMPRFRLFRVAGLFQTGMYEYDTGRVYITMQAARDFLRMDQGVSGVELVLDDIFNAPSVAAELSATLGAPYRVRDWTEMNASLFGALKLEKVAMLVILGLVILVAAFNIASTLIMVVLEKARDIGILKSLGASTVSIRRIFLTEGAVIGITGSAVGTVLGTGIAWSLKKFEFLRLPQDVYYNDTLPVVMEPVAIVLTSVMAVLLCLGAALYPSWQAARLNPVETIRYE